MATGILITKGQTEMVKTVFCSRYQVKNKRVPGVVHFSPHKGPGKTRGHCLVAQELGRLVSCHLGSNILDTQKASTTFLPPP